MLLYLVFADPVTIGSSVSKPHAGAHNNRILLIFNCFLKVCGSMTFLIGNHHFHIISQLHHFIQIIHADPNHDFPGTQFMDYLLCNIC